MTSARKYKVKESSAAHQVRSSVTRVNARFDAARMEKLERLAKMKGLSLSDVIRDAIDHYAENHRSADAPNAHQIAQRIGLVGCGTGPADLASNAKRYFAQGQRKKHDHR